IGLVALLLGGVKLVVIDIERDRGDTIPVAAGHLAKLIARGGVDGDGRINDVIRANDGFFTVKIRPDRPTEFGVKLDQSKIAVFDNHQSALRARRSAPFSAPSTAASTGIETTVPAG